MAGGYFKTNYADTLAEPAFDTAFRRCLLVIGIVIVALFPLFGSSYQLHLANTLLIACMIALSLNLVTGYGGMVSLGHAGFACAGGLAVAIFAAKLQVPFVATLLATLLMGGLCGLFAALPALRLRGLYFVLGTLAVHYIITYLATEYQYKAGYISGGIPIPMATLGPLSLDSPIKWYFVLGVILAIITVFYTNLVRSKMGRALIAIKHRDIAAEAFGVDLGRYKVIAFILSGATAALAGGLEAYYLRYMAVESYTLWLAVLYLAMPVVGGMGSILGSFLGATIITLLPFALSAFSDLLGMSAFYQQYTTPLQMSLFGIVIILFLIFEPGGLVAIWVRIRNFFELWPFKYIRAK